jgi:hypothetical protein
MNGARWDGRVWREPEPLRNRVRRLIGQVPGKHLQRHIPIELPIMGAIDDSHAACANLPDNAVNVPGSAQCRGGTGHSEECYIEKKSMHGDSLEKD